MPSLSVTIRDTEVHARQVLAECRARVDASNYNNTPVVLVGILAIGISGLIIDGILRSVERRVVPWRGKI
ncbi:hypothetical protein HQO44_16060 [Rhodococcus fascians]|nr:hypothetical protein [Rhodococcus fascians]